MLTIQRIKPKTFQIDTVKVPYSKWDNFFLELLSMPTKQLWSFLIIMEYDQTDKPPRPGQIWMDNYGFKWVIMDADQRQLVMASYEPGEYIRPLKEIRLYKKNVKTKIYDSIRERHHEAFYHT